ncbi:hypothetical protein OJF2_39190 [Aquisphaera giovannonii]|uniref:YggT family protein n=1 Tax=Aquisphaera giovannonii TaxID=406548 RepID=A0A5B9W517_9BACT|nr:hypothetical protein [Aquisphaera giovannonii]QEH35367.1 hypothetical protein OJF2_39190 [Aquisphaera giovannonii]
MQVVLNLIFACVLAFLIVSVVLRNYVYFFKVLPALKRDGLDDRPKFTLSEQMAQIDYYLDQLPPAPRPWYLGVLSDVDMAFITAMAIAFGLLVALGTRLR